ncbi:hypothetical protein [Rosistilla oblonga]|uniref:hypothetical protein n=1 Tax=Rosistilla oblonga TaxID=2527990 RepID=UPI003A9846DA
MESIDTFIRKLLRIRRRLARLPQPEFSGDWPNGFPSSESLNAILLASYYASLEQYEGRTIRTVLNWTHPAFGRSYIHRFDSPSLDYSAKNMRQLAQVADGISSNLSLVLDDDRLAMSGIEFCWPFGGALTNDGFVPGVKISIKGPGHIEYQEGTLALAYNKGRQTRLRPLQQNGAIQAWIADTERDLQEQAISSLKNDAVWGRHEEQPHFPNGVMLTFLCSVIRTIDNGGHGGTLLVVPTADDAKRVDIRFPALSNDLTTLVRRFGEASLLAAKQGFSTTSPLSPNVVTEHNIMSTLDAFGVAFAKLANCDGAIVMTRDAKLLGFGGIIQPPASTLHEGQPRQARGARHTSAQWLCESVPNAIALVVSADRGITLIHSMDGNTQILKDFVVW